MKRLTVLMLLFCVNASRGTDQPLGSERPPERFAVYALSRDDLNKPITPFELYVDVSVSGGITDRYVRCLVLRGKPISKETLASPFELQSQVLPDRYIWTIIGNNGSVIRQWLANFIKNRDGTYHTIVFLSEEELRSSRLELLIEDVDGDGNREDIRLILDMSDYDWRITTREVWQSR